MHLVIRQDEGFWVVDCPDHFLDASNANHFKRDLHAVLEVQPRVLLNLANVQFLDSSGIGALLSCLRRASAAGGDIKIFGLADTVRSVMEMTRLHNVFDFYETEDDARATCCSPVNQG